MPNTRQPMTPEEIKRFIFAGNASITLRCNINDHKLVYKINPPKDSKDVWFVNINTEELPITNWRYVGCIFSNNPCKLVITKKSKFHTGDKEWYIFDWLLRVVHNMDKPRSDVEVTHNGFCGRCGRHLTDDKSVERGYGAYCWSIFDTGYEPACVKAMNRFMRRKIECVGSDSSGMISLIVNGKEYSYKVDALSIHGWIKMINRGKGFKALGQIKKHCTWWRNDTTGKITFT